MMLNQAHDIRQWNFRSSDQILPDANFWVNVFGPSAAVGHRAQQIQAYSGALQQILSNQASLFLDVLILSEFVNTLARFEFNANYRQQYQNFKQFRKSPDFRPTAKMIARECRKIKGMCTLLDHSLTEWPIDQLFNDFEQGDEDFNDQLIVEQSKKHNFILLTDDGDMTKGGLSVLTANSRLLQACP